MPANPCQLGSRFSRCQNPPIDSCQYCGRRFCAGHTHYREDLEAVCTRKACRAKRDDLAVHLEYRAGVERRNHAGLCGIEGCGPHPASQCSLCQGRFCENHTSQRRYTIVEGRTGVERWVSVCQRCWQRRKVWGRVR